jgi:hypothetical protein
MTSLFTGLSRTFLLDLRADIDAELLRHAGETADEFTAGVAEALAAQTVSKIDVPVDDTAVLPASPVDPTLDLPASVEPPTPAVNVSSSASRLAHSTAPTPPEPPRPVAAKTAGVEPEGAGAIAPRDVTGPWSPDEDLILLEGFIEGTIDGQEVGRLLAPVMTRLGRGQTDIMDRFAMLVQGPQTELAMQHVLRRARAAGRGVAA